MPGHPFDALDQSRVERLLAERGWRAAELHPLPGDVSSRRYLRVVLEGGGRVILALYPAELEGACERFLKTGQLLADIGVRVPRVLAEGCLDGWMVVEDLGGTTLYEQGSRSWPELVPWYRQAIDHLRRIATLPPREVSTLSPALDRDLLGRELRQTWEVFLEPRGLAGSGAFRTALHTAFHELCARLAESPPGPCHRDFMPRNLVPLVDEGTVAVLDHQDLRLGPPFYDLASLLNDSLFPPAAVEEELTAPLLRGAEDRLRYHRAAAQRTLKAVGTFAAFAARGQERHLPLIPPTLRRTLHHLEALPETGALVPEVARSWEAFLGQP